MLRLIKLLAYSLLGYVLYELYLGMTEGIQTPARSSAQALGTERKDAGATTGGSAGRTVQVEEPNGAQAMHKVGRGVIH